MTILPGTGEEKVIGVWLKHKGRGRNTMALVVEEELHVKVAACTLYMCMLFPRGCKRWELRENMRKDRGNIE